MKTRTTLITLLILTVTAVTGFTQDVVPSAILTFNERGSGVKGEGEKVSDILFAELVANPALYLVDRAELSKTLDEQELNLSGLVNPNDAIQIGQLTGAKILITGSIIEAGNTQYLVAKIISSETSRVLGASVKGRMSDELSSLVPQLAEQIAETVKDRSNELLADVRTHEDRVKAVKAALPERKLPTLFVNVEERHIGQRTIDPAAETELQWIAKEAGFPLVDQTALEKADIRLVGEAFSEFALRRGNMVSVKARVEIKALDRNDNIIAVDRQTRVAVDLSEQIAGKTALQEAAGEIAERLLVKLVRD